MSNQSHESNPSHRIDQRNSGDPEPSHRIDPPDLFTPGPPHPLDQQTQFNPVPPPDQPNPDPGPTGESTSEHQHGSPDAPVEESKICYTCAQFLPASHFRLRSRATGVRMTECRACFNRRETTRNRKKRAREKGWAIHKTASQIARSPDLARTTALLENLVNVMGGPEKLVEAWHAECWRLINQKRSSTRLPRMYEMLITMMGQVRRK